MWKKDVFKILVDNFLWALKKTADPLICNWDCLCKGIGKMLCNISSVWSIFLQVVLCPSWVNHLWTEWQQGDTRYLFVIRQNSVYNRLPHITTYLLTTQIGPNIKLKFFISNLTSLILVQLKLNEWQNDAKVLMS